MSYYASTSTSPGTLCKLGIINFNGDVFFTRLTVNHVNDIQQFVNMFSDLVKTEIRQHELQNQINTMQNEKLMKIKHKYERRWRNKMKYKRSLQS